MNTSINKAISYLWNSYDWKFKKRVLVQRTKPNKREYTKPIGLINKTSQGKKQVYGVKLNGEYLDYISNFYNLDKQSTGKTDSFYIDNNYICLYPVPEESNTLEIEYMLLPYGLNEDDEEIYSLKEDTDYINIPEEFEELFKNCVISKAMMYAIAEETDENYSAYDRQYREALEVLLRFCLDDDLEDKRYYW